MKLIFKKVFLLFFLIAIMTLSGCVSKLFDFFHDDNQAAVATTTNVVVKPNNDPGKPTISKPYNLQTSVNGNPIIISSAFSDQDNTDTHYRTDWEIYDNAIVAAANRVWFKLADNVNLTSIDSYVVNGTYENALAGNTFLTSGSSYWCRCRYYDNRGKFSEWSDLRQFTVTSSKLYVTSKVNGTLQEVNLATRVVDSTPIGISTWGIDISTDGSVVYIGDQGDNSIYSYNIASTATLNNGAGIVDPVGVHYSPSGEIYIANINLGNVSIRGPDALTVSDTFSFGVGTDISYITSSHIMAFDYTYISASGPGANSIYVLITIPPRVLFHTIPAGDTPKGLALTPDDEFLYVVNAGNNKVTVIDINTATGDGTFVKTIDVGIGPDQLSISPDGNWVYVANVTDGTVSVIDKNTNTVTGTVTVGISPTSVSFSSDSVYAYVVNSGSDNVSVIDTKDLSIAYTIPKVMKGSLHVIKN